MALSGDSGNLHGITIDDDANAHVLLWRLAHASVVFLTIAATLLFRDIVLISAATKAQGNRTTTTTTTTTTAASAAADGEATEQLRRRANRSAYVTVAACIVQAIAAVSADTSMRQLLITDTLVALSVPCVSFVLTMMQLHAPDPLRQTFAPSRTPEDAADTETDKDVLFLCSLAVRS